MGKALLISVSLSFPGSCYVTFHGATVGRCHFAERVKFISKKSVRTKTRKYVGLAMAVRNANP